MLNRLLDGDTDSSNYTVEFVSIYFDEFETQKLRYKLRELEIGDNDGPEAY